MVFNADSRSSLHFGNSHEVLKTESRSSLCFGNGTKVFKTYLKNVFKWYTMLVPFVKILDKNYISYQKYEEFAKIYNYLETC
jgi:hypothetical protein